MLRLAAVPPPHCSLHSPRPPVLFALPRRCCRNGPTFYPGRVAWARNPGTRYWLPGWALDSVVTASKLLLSGQHTAAVTHEINFAMVVASMFETLASSNATAALAPSSSDPAAGSALAVAGEGEKRARPPMSVLYAGDTDAAVRASNMEAEDGAGGVQVMAYTNHASLDSIDRQVANGDGDLQRALQGVINRALDQAADAEAGGDSNQQ